MLSTMTLDPTAGAQGRPGGLHADEPGSDGSVTDWERHRGGRHQRD